MNKAILIAGLLAATAGTALGADAGRGADGAGAPMRRWRRKRRAG